MARKKHTVPISSMEELLALLDHNFDILDRRTKKLRKGGQGLKVLYVIAMGCAIYAAIENRRQEEMVYQLSVRVQKLERGEGE